MRLEVADVRRSWRWSRAGGGRAWADAACRRSSSSNSSSRSSRRSRRSSGSSSSSSSRRRRPRASPRRSPARGALEPHAGCAAHLRAAQPRRAGAHHLPPRRGDAVGGRAGGQPGRSARAQRGRRRDRRVRRQPLHARSDRGHRRAQPELRHRPRRPRLAPRLGRGGGGGARRGRSRAATCSCRTSARSAWPAPAPATCSAWSRPRCRRSTPSRCRSMPCCCRRSASASSSPASSAPPAASAARPRTACIDFLVRAGGVDPGRGSYRDIAVQRGGRTVATSTSTASCWRAACRRCACRKATRSSSARQRAMVGADGAVRNNYLFEVPGRAMTGRELIDYARPLPSATNAIVRGTRGGQPFSRYASLAELSRPARCGDQDTVTFITDSPARTVRVTVEGSRIGPSVLVADRDAHALPACWTTSRWTRCWPTPARSSCCGPRVAQQQRRAIDEALDRLERQLFIAVSRHHRRRRDPRSRGAARLLLHPARAAHPAGGPRWWCRARPAAARRCGWRTATSSSSPSARRPCWSRAR